MLDIPADEGRDGQDVDMGLVGSLEPARDDFIGQILLQQMGAGKGYVREKRQAVKRILISEIYSPLGITKEIDKGKWKHMAPGFALDLTVNDPSDGMPWDFSFSGKRKKALALLREQKPYLLIGSPACKAFSAWMTLNRARTDDTIALDKALA